jgi:hypothetical protein
MSSYGQAGWSYQENCESGRGSACSDAGAPPCSTTQKKEKIQKSARDL